nr:extracellular solute-binding protein [Mycobacterium sp.]
MKPANPLTALLAVLGLIVALTGCGGGGKSGESPTLTVYSANGLGAWYEAQFAKFSEETGIKVNLFEAGSGELVSRLNSGAVWERLNNDGKSIPPADLLVTLPPFIQKADSAGLLQPSGADADGIPAELVGPGGNYVPIVKTALCFIANPAAEPTPVTWQDLLDPRFKGKLQYSTPGEAGDGTAVLLLLQHLMGKQGALDYLAKLQANNVGPAASTSSLQPKVNSGELLVANGDVQMNLASINNDGSKFDIFFPAMPDNSR